MLSLVESIARIILSLIDVAQRIGRIVYNKHNS